MRKKVFQKSLTSKRLDVLTRGTAKLNKRIGRNILPKIRDFVLKEKHIQRLLLLLTNLIQGTYSKLLSLTPHKKVKQFEFGGHFKAFFSPLNLFALLLLNIAVAVLIWVGNLLWIDLNYWNKDVTLALFGSRTGEAISLGMGMTVFHYLLIGVAIFSSSVLLIESQKFRGLNPRGIVKLGKMRELLSALTTQIRRQKIPQLSFRRTSKRRTLVFVTVFALSCFTFLNVFLLNSIIGQTATKASLQSYGSIRTIGVGIYSNGYCVSSVSVVDWGALTPGNSNSRTFYIRNEGSSDVTLTLLTRDWSPSAAENYLSLSWDYNGETLGQDEIVAVTFTLSVSQGISGIETFSFGIDIIGAS